MRNEDKKVLERHQLRGLQRDNPSDPGIPSQTLTWEESHCAEQRCLRALPSASSPGRGQKNRQGGSGSAHGRKPFVLARLFSLLALSQGP